MFGAFQPTAFQGNAFQIIAATGIAPPVTRDTHDGLPRRKPRGHRKQVLGNIIRVYEEVRQAEPKDELLSSIVEPYIEESEIEIVADTSENRTLPAAAKIDFERMIQDDIAMMRLSNTLKNLEYRLGLINKAKNEDDMLLIMLAATV